MRADSAARFQLPTIRKTAISKKVAGMSGREGAGKIAPCNICRET